MFRKLPLSFYSQSTLSVARALLGKYFIRRKGREYLVGRIVEVEAYLGTSDPASHAYKGRTRRNEVMFGRAGHLYVYFTYGMHFCANVTTERDGKAGAVLIRAVEPVHGTTTMIRNRSKAGLRQALMLRGHLTNGPAKLCQAFGITRRQNGVDLLGDEIFLAWGTPVPSSCVGRTARIGIRRATNKKWRFVLRGNRWVSRS